MESGAQGVAVPIPTFPPAAILILSVELDCVKIIGVSSIVANQIPTPPFL